MSEIEKMYKLAQIANEGYDAWDAKDIYPPFTAEKQIELIKWLGKNKQGIGIDFYSCRDAIENIEYWNIGVKFEWEQYKYFVEQKEFEQALAGIINKIWANLTEKHQNEIKEILE